VAGRVKGFDVLALRVGAQSATRPHRNKGADPMIDQGKIGGTKKKKEFRGHGRKPTRAEIEEAKEYMLKAYHRPWGNTCGR